MPGIGLSAYICCSGKQICSPCLSAALPFLTGSFPFLSFFLFWLCLGHVPSQGSNPRSSHRLISRFCRRFCSSMWPWSQQSQLLDSALSWGAAECSPFLARGISKNRVDVNTVSAVPCLTQGGGGAQAGLLCDVTLFQVHLIHLGLCWLFLCSVDQISAADLFFACPFSATPAAKRLHLS